MSTLTRLHLTSTFRLCTDTIKIIKTKSETDGPATDSAMECFTLMLSPKIGYFSYHQLSAPFSSFSIATTMFGS